MNTEKIGKYIAKLRKEKNMTQKELANKLNITDRAISKWERGNGSPDLSLLIPLSKELDVTVNDLLSGERVNNEKYEETVESNMVNIISKVDTDKKKIKNIALVTTLILTAIFIFGLYFISNFNQIRVYEFNGYNETSFIGVRGNATFNKQINLLNIEFSSNRDILLKNISITMYANTQNGKRMIFGTGAGMDEEETKEHSINPEMAISLIDFLNNKSYIIRENYGYEEYFTDEIIKDFDVYFEIKYTDLYDVEHDIKIDLDITSFSNNKFLNNKAPKI